MMRGRTQGWFVPAALATILLLGACGGGEKGKSEDKAGEKKGAEVNIEGFAFKPETIEVSAGDSVEWYQKDDTQHTITSGDAGAVDPATSRANPSPDGKFDSGNISKGEEFEFEFKEAGTYKYFCKNHPEGMRGEVVVS